MLDRIDEIQVIEAQAIFNQRKWSRYGILSYVKFLLKNNMMIISIYKDDEYSAMTPEEKLAYCKTFFRTIAPFAKDTNGVEKINPIYIDMLDFFLENKGDIQNFMEEYSGLQKIGEDAIKVVRHVFSNQKSAEQVIQMIRAYIQTLDARDLTLL